MTITGVCRVCGGEVKQKEEIESGKRIIRDYYYCQNCGVRYEFVPPPAGG